jgi:NAD(P)-dependent dehydrogenase (short-subunit alcohol dehydrogenase family)
MAPIEQGLLPAEFAATAARAVNACAPLSQRERALRLAGDGLLGVIAQDDVGGLGLPLSFAMPVVAAANAALLGFPLMEALLLGRALFPSMRRMAEAVVAGEKLVTIAWQGAVTLDRHGDTVVVNGAVARAPVAANVDYVLMRAGDSAAALIPVGTEGVLIEPATGLDLTVPEHGLRLENVRQSAGHLLAEGSWPALCADAGVMRAAAMLGSAEACPPTRRSATPWPDTSSGLKASVMRSRGRWAWKPARANATRPFSRRAPRASPSAKVRSRFMAVWVSPGTCRCIVTCGASAPCRPKAMPVLWWRRSDSAPSPRSRLRRRRLHDEKRIRRMSEPTKELAGKVALITGAGHGIGRATALRMAARGAVVGVNDLKQEFVDETIAQIKARGGNAVALARDVSTREGMRNAVLGFAEAQGRFDILVNNAAWVRYQPVAEIGPETMERMLNIGFKAVVWGIQAAAEVMEAARGGAIINVASVAGLISAKNSILYSGIKAGVMGITRAAAAELGARNIRVNAVAPSAIPTEGTMRNRNAEVDARRVAKTPLGRLGTVDDIAKAICFLAGADSEFLSAQVLTVDGGITTTNLL